MKLVTSIARAAQLLFSVVVLGLSITLAKGQGVGSVPAETGYAAFTGALGIIAGLLGIVAFFLDSLDGVITWLVDGVAGIALLAGGIVYAIGLHGTNCDDWLTLAMNKLLDGGCVTVNNGDTSCWWALDNSKLHSRCVSAQADTAFMFLGFIACVGALIASFLSGRR